MKEIDRINVHPLKEIFDGEASGFTPWLTKNIGVLAEKLGINISEAVMSKMIGNLSSLGYLKLTKNYQRYSNHI